MSWTAQQKIRLGFALLTLLPVVLGAVAIHNAFALSRSMDDVQHTNDIVKELHKLLSLLKDVEVGQREFVLSGNEGVVSRVHSLRTEVESGLKRLDELRAEKHWIELLRWNIRQKFDEIDATVKVRRDGGVEAASQLMMADRGVRAMDDIRAGVQRVIADEDVRLDKRSEVERNNLTATMIVFGAVLLLNVALIWSVFFLIRRESAHVREMNVELEQRVRQRTQDLQRSNEDLQQFAFIVSHDLKEPMRMISSYSTLLQRRYTGKLDADADTYIGYLVEGVKRMNSFVTDLLDYSRAGNDPEQHLELVDTEDAVSEALDNLQLAIVEANAEITRDPLPAVYYDPAPLCQVFQNLIGNAIKYRAERRPTIHIGARRDGNDTVFSVRDNGLGIEPKYVEEVFGIFKRLHGKEVEGTGVGLATCRRIVERRGGRIWVESHPGDGATFYFTVPARAGAAAEGATTA